MRFLTLVYTSIYRYIPYWSVYTGICARKHPCLRAGRCWPSQSLPHRYEPELLAVEMSPYTLQRLSKPLYSLPMLGLASTDLSKSPSTNSKMFGGRGNPNFGIPEGRTPRTYTGYEFLGSGIYQYIPVYTDTGMAPVYTASNYSLRQAPTGRPVD